MTHRWVAGLIAIATALALTACGADAGPRPITQDEALRLSEALFENYDAGGATFSLSMASPTGTTTRMVGEVDWANQEGRALVQSTGPDAAVTEIAWTQDVIVEHVPALPEVAAQFGQSVGPWVARASDPVTFELDSLIAVVAALGTQTRDNPELLAQRDITWLREDEVSGQSADVFLYGDRTRLWLVRGGTQVLRLEGNNSVGNRPVLVDLGQPGTIAISFPDVAEVTAVSDIPDIYGLARGLF